MTLKLRILGGIYAPDWAKNLDGAPFPYVEGTSSDSEAGTLGRFWTSKYAAAYDDLQTKLAAIYDNVPQIREVTDSRCTTIDDELFVRQFGVAQNEANIRAAGYTTAADEQCISDSFAEQQVWQHTTTDVAFSPLPDVNRPGGGGGNLAYPIAMMSACRAELGSRCGLQNDALSAAKISDPKYSPLYKAMRALGGTIVLQTATCSRIGDAERSLMYAVGMRADSVELPRGYQSWPRSVLGAASSHLDHNAGS